eukprot:TRINITY_DN39439_c0_g1_i1.p1 TRINITY_DN39439_c0_g1~~TRINITY_DN39439_c0_g1_i1.p1  ORF type:complete len:335 (+),score=72.64 TRINITY_DN39439_c0_g1_i1:1-1005(+)
MSRRTLQPPPSATVRIIERNLQAGGMEVAQSSAIDGGTGGTRWIEDGPTLEQGGDEMDFLDNSQEEDPFIPAGEASRYLWYHDNSQRQVELDVAIAEALGTLKTRRANSAVCRNRGTPSVLPSDAMLHSGESVSMTHLIERVRIPGFETLCHQARMFVGSRCTLHRSQKDDVLTLDHLGLDWGVAVVLEGSLHVSDRHATDQWMTLKPGSWFGCLDPKFSLSCGPELSGKPSESPPVVASPVALLLLLRSATFQLAHEVGEFAPVGDTLGRHPALEKLNAEQLLPLARLLKPVKLPPRTPLYSQAVSYTHLRAHETPEHLVCRLLLEKKKRKNM